MEFVLANRAILVMPDYRLLPEASGREILEDLAGFWGWFGRGADAEEGRSGSGSGRGLGGFLRGVHADLRVDWGKVAVFGESAGGYLAIRSALLGFPVGARDEDVDGGKFEGPKAIIAAYPMTLLKAKWYSEASDTKSPFGVPQLDEGILDSHIEGLGKDGVSMVVSVDPPARLELAIAMVQRGKWTEIFARDGGEGLWLEDLVEGVERGEGGQQENEKKAAYLFVYHGMRDSAVPWEDTREWVEIWGKKFGEDRARGVWREGMEHGFDGALDVQSEEAKWLREGLEEVRREWLRN